MRLKDYLKKNKITQANFASLIGISQGYLSLIVRGLNNPSFKLALKIEKITLGQVTTEDLNAFLFKNMKFSPFPVKC
jgi:transcriptional regulator with XRE-family HTH domain